MEKLLKSRVPVEAHRVGAVGAQFNRILGHLTDVPGRFFLKKTSKQPIRTRLTHGYQHGQDHINTNV